MRIAIDLTATPKSKTGIGRYMLGLLKGLQETDKDNEYFLFAQDDDLDGFGVYAPNFHMIPVNSKINRKTYLRILWEKFVFPWRLRKVKADLVHCPNYTLPYPAKLISRHTKMVAVFHDMTYFIHPEYLVGWKCKMFQHYIKRSAKKADKIISISENSKADIPNFCKPRNPDIAVTYMGVKEDFFNSTPADDALLGKYGIDGKYIIYVGTLEPRKNIPGLMKGYSALPEEIRAEYKLVIVGKKGWYYDEIFQLANNDPHLKDNVILTGYVEDSEMMRLMRSSSAVAYLSFYEGFGIPVIEGMASGAPTVTTSVSSLAEVAGDCCFLCDPADVNSIAAALKDAVTYDDADGSHRERAIERAKFFSWENCAKATLEAYKDAMNR